MSEKKRFRIGDAVVNLNAMKLELAESVVALAEASRKCVLLPAAADAPSGGCLSTGRCRPSSFTVS